MLATKLFIVFACFFTVSANLFIDRSGSEPRQQPNIAANNLRSRSTKHKLTDLKKGLEYARQKVDREDRVAETEVNLEWQAPTVYQKYAGFPNYRLAYQDITFPETKKWNRAYLVGVNSIFGESLVNLNAVLVPMKTTFHPSGSDPVTYDSMEAIDNIKKSPIFNNAQFPNGNGQYLTQLMKANFPNAHKNWKLQFNAPRIQEQVELDVSYDDGDIYHFTNKPKYEFGGIDNEDLAWDFMVDYIDEQVTSNKAIPGTVFIFVSQNAYIGESAGFHGYHRAQNGNTYFFIWTSWFNPKDYPDFPLFYPDTYALSHEVAAWAFDYDLHNDAPNWICPTYAGSGNAAGCTNNYFGFEVGNVLNCGNRPVPPGKKYYSNGNTYGYSIQTVALWQWFTGDAKITGQNGAYSFPDSTILTTPAQFCGKE